MAVRYSPDSPSAETKELTVLEENINELTQVVEQSPHTIGASLLAKKFVSRPEYKEITSSSKQATEKATLIVNCVMRKTRANYVHFYTFLQVLVDEGAYTEDIVTKLAKGGTYSVYM